MPKYIVRDIEEELIDLAKEYPVITITGPRQSGKTTLVRNVFKNKQYISLEDPDQKYFAIEDPRAFLNRFDDTGVILDEIQRTPHLLSYIQRIVDETKMPGQFILTGSNQFELSNEISQSLAGRTGILKLLPFSFSEINNYIRNASIEEIITNGFYPAVQSDNLKPFRYYANYYETYVERDVRNLVNIKDLSLFRKFIRLCSGRTNAIYLRFFLFKTFLISSI